MDHLSTNRTAVINFHPFNDTFLVKMVVLITRQLDNFTFTIYVFFQTNRTFVLLILKFLINNRRHRVNYVLGQGSFSYLMKVNILDHNQNREKSKDGHNGKKWDYKIYDSKKQEYLEGHTLISNIAFTHVKS